MLIQSSSEKIKFNSALLRNPTAPFLKSKALNNLSIKTRGLGIGKQPILSPLLRNSGNLRRDKTPSGTNGNSPNLQKIEEEFTHEENNIYPLYRSVRIKGAKSKISSIIRNAKMLESLTKKQEVKKILNLLQ